MATAAQTLITIVERLIGTAGAADAYAAELQSVKDQANAEEAEIQALREQIAALPAPFDAAALEARVAALEEALKAGGDTALVDRVQALEERNAADDEAAAAIPGVAVSSGETQSGAPTEFALSVDGQLPDATVGSPYSYQIGAAGGSGPYQFSILTGALPEGLSLAPCGAITGTPTTARSLTAVVQAHDANGAHATTLVAITVEEAAVEEPVAEEEQAEAAAPQA